MTKTTDPTKHWSTVITAKLQFDTKQGTTTLVILGPDQITKIDTKELQSVGNRPAHIEATVWLATLGYMPVGRWSLNHRFFRKDVTA